MKLTARHRRAAHTLWECGGRIEDAAAREHVLPVTLRRWLSDPDFRSAVAEDALEPLLQATSAMLRWAPVAVARLIQDLEGESSAEARQAAREILKLALDTQRELARPFDQAQGGAASADSSDAALAKSGDPLSARIAALTDEQLAQVLALVNQQVTK
jgi:hypothetical protein